MKDKIRKLLINKADINSSYGINAYSFYDHNIDELVDLIVKLLDLHSVSNNEADLDCDYDITAKVPFKSKKRYKVKVISEVTVCPYCDTELEDANQDICMDCWNKHRNP